MATSKLVNLSELREAAKAFGLDGVGVARAYPVPVDPDLVRPLALRMPKGLDYVPRRLKERLDPGLILEGVRSVVVAFVSYASDLPGASAVPKGRGFISRYAWGLDYHTVLQARLARLSAHLQVRYGGKVKYYVDTGPVFEKAYGQAAKLGFIGKNTLLINPVFGSFIFLGVILTDLDFEGEQTEVAARCGHCEACIRACPTRAIKGDFTLDPSRCLAHLTVTKGCEVPEDLANSLSNNLFGCDICQDVCPYNKRAIKPNRLEFLPLPGLYMPRIRDILEMDERRFFSTFGMTPVAMRGLPLLQHTARLLARVQGLLDGSPFPQKTS